MTNSKPNWKIREENEVSWIMTPWQLPSSSRACPDTFTYPGAAGMVWRLSVCTMRLCVPLWPIFHPCVSVRRGAYNGWLLLLVKREIRRTDTMGPAGQPYSYLSTWGQDVLLNSSQAFLDLSLGFSLFLSACLFSTRIAPVLLDKPKLVSCAFCHVLFN